MTTLGRFLSPTRRGAAMTTLDRFLPSTRRESR